MNMHNFTPGAPINRSIPQTALTLDQLRTLVPSAFAAGKHESRSDKFTYIPTGDVIAGLMHEGFQPFKAVQSRSRIPGKTEFTKHMIRFRHVDSLSALKVGDTVPEVVIVNAHDGTAAYSISEGLWRLVCSNGLMVPDSIVQSLKIPHRGNIVDEVIEGSFQIVQQSEKALAKVEEFTQLRLTDGEQDAFADAARELRFADAEGKIQTPVTAAQLLRPRRREDMDSTERNWNRPAHDLWTTVNVVQEHVIKGGDTGTKTAIDEHGRFTRRRATTREVKNIDMDMRLNRALFTLAERMATLKKAA